MAPSGHAALGQALTECLSRSQGGYVLLRTGQRWQRDADRAQLEYRVNVRTPDGGELTTTSGQTPLIALQRAAARLQARREERRDDRRAI